MAIPQPPGSELIGIDASELGLLRDAMKSASFDASAPLSATPQSAGDIKNAIALMGRFNPVVLFPTANMEAMRALLDSCTVSTDGVGSTWSLRLKERARILGSLLSNRDALRLALSDAKRFSEGEPGVRDSFATAIQDLSVGRVPSEADFAAMSHEQLAAHHAALNVFEQVQVPLAFDSKKALVNTQLTELLEPLRFLVGYDPATGRDVFVGRERELDALRTFLGRVPIDGDTASVRRLFKRLSGFFSEQSRLLFLSGVGGIGKSTLLAKFILEAIKIKRSGVAFAYLDLDRAALNPAQPLGLVLEMLRQIELQDLDRSVDSAALRARVRSSAESLQPQQEQSSNDVSMLHDHFASVRELLSSPGVESRTFLLVIDTFEQAQFMGGQVVDGLRQLIDVAMDSLPNVRVLISGRGDAEDSFPLATRLRLDALSDQPSRVAFLSKRGVSDPVAAEIAKEVGGRPLALLIASKLVKEQSASAANISLLDRFKSLFNDHLIEGILYARILDHIQDPEIRELAHPGLIVRRLDEEVLRRVVGPALGKSIDGVRAQTILAMFSRQTDLMKREADGALVHLPVNSHPKLSRYWAV